MNAGELENKLLSIISDISEGRYSDDIMELTRNDVPDPVRTIAEAVALMMVKVEAREFQLQQLVDQLKELNKRIKENTIAVVTAMAQALAARDAYTEGHASRVAEFSYAIARELGFEGEALEYVRLGGALHDIGKIGFPDILFSSHEQRLPSNLVKEINRHPAIGVKILEPLDFLGPAIDYVSAHHERLDGRGYPRGLKGDQIPLGAQIVSVADIYDAITSERPYQETKTSDEALAILYDISNTRVRIEIVQALERVLANKDAS
ncbi:MAG TPA: HD domain-containing protein [Syntrophorhabdaceae bacterium]|nr:HD domain-containing protein [Syntrophorhabdaceae bacterium]